MPSRDVIRGKETQSADIGDVALEIVLEAIVPPEKRAAARAALRDRSRRQVGRVMGREKLRARSWRLTRVRVEHARRRGGERRPAARRNGRARARSPGRSGDDEPSPPRAPLGAAEREYLRLEISRRRRRAVHRAAGLRRELLAGGAR